MGAVPGTQSATTVSFSSQQHKEKKGKVASPMLSRSGVTSRPDFEAHILSLSLKWAANTVGPTDS